MVLNGTFTGHFSDSLATAQQTVQFELHWNAGPDDIHDSNAFTLASGTFTFSESIGGVCGGSRDEEGPLTSYVNQQSLLAAEPQDRDNAQLLVIDRRLSGGGVEFSVFSSFEVPNSDPEGCGDLDRSGVGSCPLVFLQAAIGELQQDAECTSAGGEWTGQLRP
ncbi:MAG: hypothetical protein ABI841_07785 [Chloroflexota bacterium]